MRLRAYMEGTVRPVINDYWERAEFPHDLIASFLETDVARYPFAETRPFENSAVFRGLASMEMARVDASMATFVGVQEGLVDGLDQRVRVAGAAGRVAPEDGVGRGARRVRR